MCTFDASGVENRKNKAVCVFSFSWFNTEEEIKTVVNALKELSRG